ncbi:MAG: class I SAM-dependent methyltransferase [Candidatus Palauibacterales bacterium]|nr:class I SAM-dependent methyltransferase [Candidatus Palauibacterales bacterium]MDP2482479.1 class I SAM-dependent methyltransferase [Candidatus Palauibacterales bacterium]
MSAGMAKADVPREFDRVARSYELLTGLNPGYRRHLRLSAARLEVPPGGEMLDLCCGTGASTRAILSEHPQVRVTAADASSGMLAEAARRLPDGRVRLLRADAMDPRASGIEGPFDAILMAYGIRNMSDPDRCLENLLGLLKPGGAICFHEYSVTDSSRARATWNAVSLGVIIPGGFLTSGTTRIYRYLRRSVLEFDGVGAFEARLRRAGFTDVRTEPMDGWQRGIVHSFLGRRPEASA